MIRSGIPTPEKRKTPIISLVNDDYSIIKHPNDSSSTSLRTETSRTKQIISLTELKSKEKDSFPSSIGVESSRVSTGNYHLSKVFSKLTP